MRLLEELTIEIIQQCNSNCIYCSSLSTKNSKHEIPLNKLKEIADFAITKQANNINISGGEPLLKTDLIDFIEYCHELNLTTNIYTSGNVSMIAFLDNIKTKNIDIDKIKLIFNYNSSEPEVFKQIVNSDTFTLDDINLNINECIKAGLDIEVHTVPSALNINSIFETCKHLKTLGVKQVSLLRLVLQGRAEKNRELLEIKDLSKLEQIINDIQNTLCDESFNLRIGIPFAQYVNEAISCNAGFSKLIIRYDGIVFPCEAFKEAPNNEKYILGDINKDSLDTIWDKYYLLNELKNLKAQTCNNCETCPAQLLYRRMKWQKYTKLLIKT